MLVYITNITCFLTNFCRIFLSNVEEVRCEGQFTGVFSTNKGKDKVDISYTGKDQINYVELCSKDASGTKRKLQGPFPFNKPATEKTETVKETILLDSNVEEGIEVFMVANKHGGNPDEDKYSMSSKKLNGKFNTMISTTTAGTVSSDGNKNTGGGFYANNKGLIIAIIVSVLVIVVLISIMFYIRR
ncbi:hypothetical protein CDIK_1021 [Cucumispora dikerogammari]|nr:hypothetical protein CDIK_1021 [Cucumispora dikerogammari]